MNYRRANTQSRLFESLCNILKSSYAISCDRIATSLDNPLICALIILSIATGLSSLCRTNRNGVVVPDSSSFLSNIYHHFIKNIISIGNRESFPLEKASTTTSTVYYYCNPAQGDVTQCLDNYTNLQDPPPQIRQ